MKNVVYVLQMMLALLYEGGDERAQEALRLIGGARATVVAAGTAAALGGCCVHEGICASDLHSASHGGGPAAPSGCSPAY